MEFIFSILTILITLILGVFTYSRLKMERRYRAVWTNSEITFKEKENSNSEIEKIVLREDVELRVLEEIVEIDKSPYSYGARGKTKRELSLEELLNT